MNVASDRNDQIRLWMRTIAALVLLCGAVGMSRMMLDGGDASARQDRVAIVSAPRPISISAGTCDDIAEVAWPLNDLVAPAGQMAGSWDADRTEYSFTANVPFTIADLLSASFAVNVVESADQPGRNLVCGNIGGVPDGIGTLVIGLRPVADLSLSGIAVLSPSPSDQSRTLVSVFIAGSELGEHEGSQQSTEVPAPDGQTPVIVDPTAVIVPTEDDPIEEPTEVDEPEPEPTEDDEPEDEPTEEDDDDPDETEEPDDDDDHGGDDDENNSGHGNVDDDDSGE